jgi:protein-S-isoprenylcysteine O-methyltransferase Ste14
MKPSVAWALVGVQGGLLAALVVLPAELLWPKAWIVTSLAAVFVATGITAVVLGGLRLGKTLTPSPIPKDAGFLATQGIYRYVRHPMYTGLLVASAGVVLWGASPAHVLGWVALLAVLIVKSHSEEAMLQEKYPEYEQYQKVSGRFLPPWRSFFTRGAASAQG